MTRANEFYLATALQVAGAILVIYLRLKRGPEGNVPLLFFGAIAAYTGLLNGELPPRITYLGLATSLLLRFEFMNSTVTRLVEFCEFAILAAIIYLSIAAFLGW